MYLSNLIKNKGIEDLLRAVSLLRNESIELVFVGGMVDVNQAWFDNRVNRYGIENITFYLGPKYGLAKEAIYESSDIFVLPTHHDCFPLVIIEAMSHGLPIISTKVGAIPDILIDEFDSYLIDPGDHMELFRKLRQLVTNPDLRRKFGKRAFSRYEKNFTKEQFLLRLDKTVTDWVDESV
ncbi:hypothetical protein DC28_12795 [Spirochaeta lutea]|uniref:Glycosyl transferase family 1 domain-containing protein n=1 Tax=Spirochaeta lutea TaxID=1480694 RepID=A0A098QXA4_9SPIO|nr:hypothetical protein DC28_12795 [Spirochaeta lutea]